MVAPIFKIEAQGQEISQRLQQQLISIGFKDADGDKSDEITLKVAGDFQRPKHQDQLKLWLGYEDSPLFYCGLFFVQSTERDGFGLTITATGADFSSGLKVRRTLSYEQVSLKEVVQTISSRHNLELQCNFDNLHLTHLSQTNESDLHFLKRLAVDYHAIFSIKNGTAIFLKRTEENAQSAKLPVFEIDAADVADITIKHTNKNRYASCIASWHDTKSNTVQSVTVGDDEPVLKLEGQFKNAAEAQAKATAKLQANNKVTVSGTLNLYGRELYAGGMLKLTGFQEDDGMYTIVSVDHTFDGGWSMSVQIEASED